MGSHLGTQKGLARQLVPIAALRKHGFWLLLVDVREATKFGQICCSFTVWAKKIAVAPRAGLFFIDRTIIPQFYTELSSWHKLGDTILHIKLLRWADIAPLSANTLASLFLIYTSLWIAGGLCDNLLTCIIRAWYYTKPSFVAPSMNAFLWRNPFTATSSNVTQ